MTRLDKHISTYTGRPRKDVRLMLAQGRVSVDGCVARDINQRIGKFNHVQIDGNSTQNNTAHYLMLNKPPGMVCATKDPEHKTVLDLLPMSIRGQLHIAGRLDYNSTGLVLLTNDGQWSRKLSDPKSRLVKRYRVTTEQPITEDYVKAFELGMYFEYENISTRPAKLVILDERTAEVGLIEGRYHQIKRMFGRFNNKVLSIHRFAVGNYQLDDLGLGDYKDVARDAVGSLMVPDPADSPVACPLASPSTYDLQNPDS